jgi:Ankyrin repeats (3 copies)
MTIFKPIFIFTNLLIFSVQSSDEVDLRTQSSSPGLWDFIYRQYAETMLLRAAAQGNLENVKYYLAQGCNIRTCDFENRTPLDLATNGDHHRVVKYLLQKHEIENDNISSHLLVAAAGHQTIHTLFTLLLWNKPESESDKNEVLSLIEKFNEGRRKKTFSAMVSDFEKYVKENKNNLPDELREQVEEYKKTMPPVNIKEYRIGLMKLYHKKPNYNFD